MATKDPTRGLPLKSSKQTRGMTPKYVPSTKSVPTSGKGPSMAPKEAKSVSSLAVADAMAKIRAASEDVRKATGRHIDPKQMEVLMTAALTNPDGAKDKAIEIADRLTGMKTQEAAKPPAKPKIPVTPAEKVEAVKEAIKEYETGKDKTPASTSVDKAKASAKDAASSLKARVDALPASPGKDSLLSRLAALGKNIDESITEARLESIQGILAGGLTRDLTALEKAKTEGPAKEEKPIETTKEPEVEIKKEEPKAEVEPEKEPVEDVKEPEVEVKKEEPKAEEPKTEEQSAPQVTTTRIPKVTTTRIPTDERYSVPGAHLSTRSKYSKFLLSTPANELTPEQIQHRRALITQELKGKREGDGGILPSSAPEHWEIPQVVTKRINPPPKSVQSTAKDVLEESKTAAKDIAGKAVSTARQVPEAAARLAGDIKKGVAAGAGEAAQGVASGAKEAVKGAALTTAAALPSMYAGGPAGAAKAATSVISGLGQSAAEGVSEAAKGASRAVKTGVDAVKNEEKPLTDQVTSSNIGSPSADPADKKPDDLKAMDINIADNAMTKSDMGPCSKCPRRDERMEAMREVSDLMGNKPSEIKALAMGDKSGSEGKCQGSCVRKVGNDWRVVSNKTGKLWPAKYGTEEKAKAALAAYHIK